MPLALVVVVDRWNVWVEYVSGHLVMKLSIIVLLAIALVALVSSALLTATVPELAFTETVLHAGHGTIKNVAHQQAVL